MTRIIIIICLVHIIITGIILFSKMINIEKNGLSFKRLRLWQWEKLKKIQVSDL